jgi:hypothetical protein
MAFWQNSILRQSQNFNEKRAVNMAGGRSNAQHNYPQLA